MADTEQPQIYLITPPEFELSSFSSVLSTILDAVDVACIRLTLSTTDEDRILRHADALREISHARDVPLVIDSHIQLVERLGLDGVHLTDGARNVRAARKTVGEDAIVGAFCSASRHDGMSAGEASADYVSFGPVAPTPLGDGSFAEHDLFAWWSQMIEVPVVAEGALTPELVERLAPVTDFFAIGAEIWEAETPLKALQTLTSALH